MPTLVVPFHNVLGQVLTPGSWPIEDPCNFSPPMSLDPTVSYRILYQTHVLLRLSFSLKGSSAPGIIGDGDNPLSPPRSVSARYLTALLWIEHDLFESLLHVESDVWFLWQ